jgi:hypothetical protein
MKYTVHELDEMRTLIRGKEAVRAGLPRAGWNYGDRYKPYTSGNSVADSMAELLADEKKLVTYMMNGTTAADLLADLDAFEAEKNAERQAANDKREAEYKAKLAAKVEEDAFREKVKTLIRGVIFDGGETLESSPEKKLSLIEKWLGK